MSCCFFFFFLHSFLDSSIGHYKVLNRRSLRYTVGHVLAAYLMYSSVYTSVPISQFISLLLLPTLVTISFVFCICDSISVEVPFVKHELFHDLADLLCKELKKGPTSTLPQSSPGV